jgi:cytoskeletal protein CcmA (bactofilin family)
MNHFDEMTALLYLERQLDAEHANEVSAHLRECPACRSLLGALEREGVWLRQSLAVEDEAIPARLMEAPERGASWGWIITLGLSAAGAYTLWSGIVEPWQARAAQAGFTQGNLLTMLFFSGAFWKGWDAMRSLMEFLAMGTLTIVLTWLLRRHWRRLSAFAAVVGFFVVALLTPSTAGAAQLKNGDPNYTLSSGQTIDTDLYVTGQRVEIDGEVDGDVIVWSQVCVVNGHVKGDVIAFVQNLRVNGTVDGNIRSFAQSVDVSGTVGRNLMSWSSVTNVEERGSVGGTATFGSNDASLDGKIGGDVVALANSLDVSGSLARNLNVHADHFSVTSSAKIDGHVKYEGPRDAQIDPGAKVGSIEHIFPKRETRYRGAHFYLHHVIMWGVGFVYGLVVLLLIPGFYADTTNACKNYGPSIGFGILFLFATPIAAFIACITIVGLAVGIASVLLWIIAMYTSTIFVAGWLGEAVLGAKAGMGQAILRLGFGLAVLHVLRVLPYIGFWTLLFSIFWGLGAMLLTAYKRLRPQIAMSPAGASLA